MLAILKGDFPSLHGLIIGDGPLRQALESHAAQLGLRSSVTFTGHLEDVAPAMSCMDLFALLSYAEGLSVANIEAIATGLPCIVTDVGGARELVIDSENGYVVDVRDVDAAVDRARRLLSDEGLRRRMGNRSRGHAIANFDVRNMVRAYQDVYERVTGSTR
jgi:glycosyltransferase involved in cell wall biosynthesis